MHGRIGPPHGSAAAATARRRPIEPQVAGALAHRGTIPSKGGTNATAPPPDAAAPSLDVAAPSLDAAAPSLDVAAPSLDAAAPRRWTPSP
ncbi:hypothetical protein ACGU38_41590, partial [Streptomyces rochei]